MSVMMYNGVILRECETKSFEQTVEYDESGTDVIFSRFKIRVASTTAVTNYPGTQFGVDGPGTPSTVAQRMHDVQNRLSEARGDFWFLVDHCPTNEKPSSSSVIDQPLLIATGNNDPGRSIFWLIRFRPVTPIRPSTERRLTF